jgi:hypothetical protein
MVRSGSYNGYALSQEMAISWQNATEQSPANALPLPHLIVNRQAVDPFSAMLFHCLI